jgi:branched-subunit amino acid aminotransferase/4-amino-4-deoxychorismate lyase
LNGSICFLNGRYLPTHEATIPVLDRGFLFGEGLFETWRTYRGLPFAVEEHLARMKRSAWALAIPFNPDEDWKARSRSLSRRCGFNATGSIFRLTITRGGSADWLIPSKAGKAIKPTRLLTVRQLDDSLGKHRAQGVAIHLLPFGSGVHRKLPNFKTLNYLPAVLGKGQAQKRGCFEGVYHLDDGTVLEGTTSNLFIVRGDKILTTPAAGGVLPGVTRAIVMKLAKKRWDVIERPFSVEELLSADEVFLTSTSIEVVPVLRTDRHPINEATVGPVTRLLGEAYRTYVARRLGLKVKDLGV